jgi:hypothetical protein
MLVLTDDVGHHAGDVVGASRPQGELNQLVGGGARVGHPGESLGQRLAADEAGQSVRAEHPPVAEVGLAHRTVDVFGGVDVADHPQHDVALRVAVGLLGGDLTLVDEPLHEGVVGGHLGQLAVTQQVGT